MKDNLKSRCSKGHGRPERRKGHVSYNFQLFAILFYLLFLPNLILSSIFWNNVFNRNPPSLVKHSRLLSLSYTWTCKIYAKISPQFHISACQDHALNEENLSFFSSQMSLLFNLLGTPATWVISGFEREDLLSVTLDTFVFVLFFLSFALCIPPMIKRIRTWCRWLKRGPEQYIKQVSQTRRDTSKSRPAEISLPITKIFVAANVPTQFL